MVSRGCDFVSVISFAGLTLIRGTTPLMAYFAVAHLNSAGLVVAGKSSIGIVAFFITLVCILIVSAEERTQIRRNLREKSVYWKIAVIGLIQAAAPYLLVVYSLQFLPPTLLGVFMAATPWFTIILERLPFVKIKSTINSYVKFGMVVGFFGIILVMAPILHETLINCSLKNGSRISTNTTNQSDSKPQRTYSELYDICLDPTDLLFGTLALIAGCLLWASSTVFWRAQRGDIHFVIASLGQNLVAGVIAVICWIIAEKEKLIGEPYWTHRSTIMSVLFLGLATGWFATILVQFLSKRIGPKPTNQVLVLLPVLAFTEDCIFVKSVTSLHPWLIAIEITGILILTVAIFVTNMPSDRKLNTNSMLSEHLIDSDNYTDIYNSDYSIMQEEADKYRILPPESDSEVSQNEEEIATDKEITNETLEDNYPPLRQITGDNLNDIRTLERDNKKDKE